MKQFRLLPYLYMALLAALLFTSCANQQQQPRAYHVELSSSDSLIIRMGQWTLTRYHSPRLGIDINYPSFLDRIDLPASAGPQEIFSMDDVSLSFMIDSLDGDNRASTQQLMGMGAELLEVTDRYSILSGQEEKWEYYAKVLEDSNRLVTIMLRYEPDHAEAAEALRQWVKDYDE